MTRTRLASTLIPAPYVKLYLVNGKRCIEKAKTTMARKTLDPFYQQLLAFKENCRGCILQVRATLSFFQFRFFLILAVFFNSFTRTYLIPSLYTVSGDSVGWLWSDRGEKSVHGYCTDRIGWAGSQSDGVRMVQAVWHPSPGQWSCISCFVPSIFGHVSRFF